MTYYKYAERDATNQIDWNKISTSIVKDMAAISEAKAKRREADQTALNESLNRLMEKPIGEDLAENQRIANFTQQAEDILLNDLRSLKRGDISRRDYNLKYNNLKMGTDRAFSLSQQYQDAYQMHVDRLTPDENGNIIASAGEADLLAAAEQYGLASDSQYYINPLTGGVNLALTTGEGEEGDIKIGDSQFDLMGMTTAKNMIFQKINKYQTQDQVKKLTDNLKVEALDVLDGAAPDGKSLSGYISTTKGFDVEALFDITEEGLVPKKGNEAAGEAVLAQINATFAGDPFARYSFLRDTMGTINGKPVEFVFADKDGNFAATEDHQVRMVLDKQGRYVPEITDSQKKKIDKSMVALVKNSIDTEFGIKADTRLTKKQRFDIGQVNRGLTEKKDSLRLSLDTMSQMYRGGAVDLEVATTYFKGIDPGVRKVDRDENGLILTIEDDDGNVKRETVSFFAQDKEGNIIKDKPLSERQFIQAASNLLLGTEKTETKEFRELWNRKDNEGNFIYDGSTRSEGSATVGEGVTPSRGRLDTTEIDSYLEGKFTTSGRKGTFFKPDVSDNIDFRDEDYQVAKQINDTFAQDKEGNIDDRVPIKAKAVGSSQRGNQDVGSGFSDLVEIRIDGYNKPPLIIPADYGADGEARKAENQLREYIKAYLTQGARGKTSQYN